MPCEHRLADTILCRPLLVQDPLPFCIGDFDQMLPTATATVVAAPVLQNGQFQAGDSHSVTQSDVIIRERRHTRNSDTTLLLQRRGAHSRGKEPD